MTTFTPTLAISEADLEGVETRYNGPDPKARQIMSGYVHRVFYTLDSKSQPMLKVLYKVYEGKYAGYNAWQNVSLIPAAAFAWQELCDDVLLVPWSDLLKMKVNGEEKAVGNLVESIGKLNLTTDEIPVMFAVAYRDYEDEQGNQSRQTNVVMARNLNKKDEV